MFAHTFPTFTDKITLAIFGNNPVTNTKRLDMTDGFQRKPNRPTDTQLAQTIEQFEQKLYAYIDKVLPNKFRHTLVEQLINTIGKAREHAIDGLAINIDYFPKDKYYHINKCQSKFYNIEMLLNHLNDFGMISDKCKAKLDVDINNIQTNASRLLNSLSARISKIDTDQSITGPHLERPSSVGTPNEESSH